MSKVINSALELIGNTPLLNASRYAKNAGIEGVTLLTKLEYLNPAGSVTVSYTHLTLPTTERV